MKKEVKVRNPFLSRLLGFLRPRLHPPSWARAAPLRAALGDKKVLEKYTVGEAAVFIAVDKGGQGYYLVEEPHLDERGEEIYSQLVGHIIYTSRPLGEAEKRVEEEILNAAYDLGILEEVQKDYPSYRYYVARNLFGYGPIHVPMLDPGVEEITLSSYSQPVVIVHRRHPELGRLESNILFRSEEEVRVFNQRLASWAGKSLTTAFPMLTATTKEGHRITLTLADEVSYPGSTFAIRKFPEEPISLPQLVAWNMLSPSMAAYLWQVMELKGFPMVAGPTGSGKTTLLNAIAATIPPNMLICTIEDTLEFQLPHKNWLRMHTRQGATVGSEAFTVTLYDLLVHAMRQRPDYILMGEARAAKDFVALMQAATLGHACACTVHADSPEAVLYRLRAPPIQVEEEGIGMIWCLVMTKEIRRSGMAARRVTSIDEVVMEGGKAVTRRLFTWSRGDSFFPSGPAAVLRRSERLREACEWHGLTEGELRAGLGEKEAIVKKLVKGGKLSLKEFMAEVRKAAR